MKRLLLLFSICLLPLTAHAFPDNGILDDFTGSDGTTPPNSNWTNAELRNGGNGGGLVIQDNAVTVPNTSGTWGAYWDTTSFNADQEAYATLVAAGSVSAINVYCRLANPGTDTSDGYEVHALDGASTIGIFRVDNGVVTQLGSDITQAIDDADRIGIQCQGSNISSWFSNDGGAWTQLDEQTDATYALGGFIGLSMVSSSTIVGGVDDFGGGNVTVAAILQSPPTPPVVLQ